MVVRISFNSSWLSDGAAFISWTEFTVAVVVEGSSGGEGKFIELNSGNIEVKSSSSSVLSESIR